MHIKVPEQSTIFSNEVEGTVSCMLFHRPKPIEYTESAVQEFFAPRAPSPEIMQNIQPCQQYDQVQVTHIQPPLTPSWQLIGTHTGHSKGCADVRCRTAALEPQECDDRQCTAPIIPRPWPQELPARWKRGNQLAWQLATVG